MCESAQMDVFASEAALYEPLVGSYPIYTQDEKRISPPSPCLSFHGWSIDLGSLLLAIWASLRFADAQRVLLNETQFCFWVVRSVCYKTKTLSHGQPFAARGWGLRGDDLTHCLLGADLHAIASSSLEENKCRDRAVCVRFDFPGFSSVWCWCGKGIVFARTS